MSHYKGKRVWITGASSGIGEALAKELSALGAKLLLSSRRTEELERVRSECENPNDVFVLEFDLEKNEQANDWVNSAWSSMGGIDLLINNGGIGQFGTSAETLSSVERKIFEINYFGNVALTKAILPKMIEAGNGHIVAISSIAAKFGQAKLAAYSASKAALSLYYESLKEEVYKQPVKLQIVSPGFIQTNVTLNSLNPDGSKLNKNSPAQEKGMPTTVFAKKFLKTIQKDKFHHYIGHKELLAVPFHQFFPGLFYKMLRK